MNSAGTFSVEIYVRSPLDVDIGKTPFKNEKKEGVGGGFDSSEVKPGAAGSRSSAGT